MGGADDPGGGVGEQHGRAVGDEDGEGEARDGRDDGVDGAGKVGEVTNATSAPCTCRMKTVRAGSTPSASAARRRLPSTAAESSPTAPPRFRES